MGQRLVEADAEAFCQSVLASGDFTPDDNFIVDGVRHVEISRILTRLALKTAAWDDDFLAKLVAA